MLMKTNGTSHALRCSRLPSSRYFSLKTHLFGMTFLPKGWGINIQVFLRNNAWNIQYSTPLKHRNFLSIGAGLSDHGIYMKSSKRATCRIKHLEVWEFTRFDVTCPWSSYNMVKRSERRWIRRLRVKDIQKRRCSLKCKGGVIINERKTWNVRFCERWVIGDESTSKGEEIVVEKKVQWYGVRVITEREMGK